MQGTRLNPIVLDSVHAADVSRGEGGAVYEFKVHAAVRGNFSVHIKKPKNCCKQIKYCDFWDNTAFMPQIVDSVVSYEKDQLDIKVCV